MRYFALLLLLVLSGTAQAQEGCTITSVTDGDTVRCGDERIRIVGYDTPELFSPDPRCRDRERAAALEAKAALTELITDWPYRVERTGAKDRRGRTLAWLSIIHKDRQIDVAVVLIVMNLAVPYECPRGRCPPAPDWCSILAEDVE